MSDFKMIMEMPESTVVAEYEPEKTRSGAYQSEAALEAAFIEMLTQQGRTISRESREALAWLRKEE